MKCERCNRELTDKDRVFRSSTFNTEIIDGNSVSKQTMFCLCEDCYNGNSKGTIDICSPVKMYEKLNEKVIGQDNAKKILATEIYKHYIRIANKEKNKFTKSNIIMTGPTGVGKTFLVKSIAEIIDVPLAVVDASSLTEAGYVGNDIESVLYDLFLKAGKNLEIAEKGIIFIDEVDKIACRGNDSGKAEIGREGVQQALLKLVEGSTVNFPENGNKQRSMGDISIDTSNILIIAAGAFSGIDGIVEQRLKKPKAISFGFGADISKEEFSENDIRQSITKEDLRKFGMVPEFLGRFSTVANLSALDKDEITEILLNEYGPIQEYKELFQLHEKTLEFTDEALGQIAEKVIGQQTGARGIKTIVEEMMLDTMFHLPDEAENCYEVTLEGITKSCSEIQTARA